MHRADEDRSAKMSKGYLDCWIEIEPNGGGAYTARLRSPVGEVRGAFTLPFDPGKLPKRKREIEKAIARSLPQVVSEFGGQLFEALSQNVRSRYHAALERSEAQGYDGVRVRLRLGDPQLAALPWEFLFDTERDGHLGLSSHTPIVRSLEDPFVFAAPRFYPPLRVLVVIPSPVDTAALDYAGERQLIQESLTRLGSDVRTRSLNYASTGCAVTLGELQHALADLEPHVLHFAGHGDVDPESGEGFLLFEEEGTRLAERVDGARLAHLVGDTRPLQLVVLSACASAQASQAGTAVDVATALVSRGVPAVVAMQFPISDEAATNFAGEFYRTFARQPVVERAVQEGRKRIGVVHNSIEWGTPVLYLQPPDGQLFQWEERSGVATIVDWAPQELDEKRLRWMRGMLAGYLGTSVEEIHIEVIQEKSVRLRVELSAGNAERLLTAYEESDPSFGEVRSALRILDLGPEGEIGRGREEARVAKVDLRFANREEELQEVLKPIQNPGAPRYLQICAPTGYGKTYLLRRADDRYQRAGWLRAHVDFAGQVELRSDKTLLLIEIGEQLGVRRRIATPRGLARGLLERKQQSVLFFDAVELASSEVRRWIKSELIPTLEERVINSRFKPHIIAASRFPIHEWRIYSRQRFKELRLTPFTEEVVDDLLRRLASDGGQEPEPSWYAEMVKAILAVSKGYPRSIQEILTVIVEEGFAVRGTDLMEVDTLNRVIGEIVDHEVLSGLRDGIKLTFKTLCVLRAYAPSILDELAADGVVQRPSFFGWDLAAELLDTHLVDPPSGGSLYRFEPLIRRVIAGYLETTEPTMFWRLNDLALRIYEEQIMGRDVGGKPLPLPARDHLQVACIVEALFHLAKRLRHRRLSAERGKALLLQDLKRYLACRRTGQNDRFWADLLLGALDRDEELQGMVYEIAQEYEFLLRPIEGLGGPEARG